TRICIMYSDICCLFFSMPRRRERAAPSDQEPVDEASTHRAESAPVQGAWTWGRPRSRPRVIAQPIQEEAPEAQRAGAAPIDDQYVGMGGLQRAVEQMLDFQRTMAQASFGRAGASGSGTGDDVPMSEYSRLRPTEYDGMTGDPVVFLDEVRKRTEDFGCSDRRAIQMADFSLTGVASQWYKDYIRPHVTGMTWDQFQSHFERQFIPFSAREEMRVRFEN